MIAYWFLSRPIPFHSMPLLSSAKSSTKRFYYLIWQHRKKNLFTLPFVEWEKKSHRQMQLLCSMQKAECFWIRHRTKPRLLLCREIFFLFNARNWNKRQGFMHHIRQCSAFDVKTNLCNFVDFECVREEPSSSLRFISINVQATRAIKLKF